jgi:hypothetical protein
LLQIAPLAVREINGPFRCIAGPTILEKVQPGVVSKEPHVPATSGIKDRAMRLSPRGFRTGKVASNL